MDSFEKAERQMIAAYFLNYHRPGTSRYIGKAVFAEEFGLTTFDKIQYAVISELRRTKIIHGFGDGRAKLNEAGYKTARQAVLTYINGTSIDVDWEKGEVLTDGELPDDFPLPKSWKWMRWDKPKNASEAAAAGGAAAAIMSQGNVRSGDVVGRDFVEFHSPAADALGPHPMSLQGGVPLPDVSHRKKPGVDWTKWGTIIAGLSLIAAIVAILIAL